MTTPRRHRRGSGLPRLAVVAALVVAVLFVGFRLGFAGDTDVGDTNGGDADLRSEMAEPATTAQEQRYAAIALLERLETAIRDGAPQRFAAVWSTSARAQDRAVMVSSNLADLGVDRFSLQYAGRIAGVPVERQHHLPEPTTRQLWWTAEVEVRWRVAGIDPHPVFSTVVFTFADDGETLAVADARGKPADSDPIWLLDDLEVVRTARTSAVATSTGEATELSADLTAAVHHVQAVLPRWRGGLVGYLPDTAAQLEALLGTAPGSHSGIAAVSASVGNGHDRRAPVAIVLNPEEFDRMDPVGRQVVVTHEATHVATRVVTVDMPLWVAEGFADYVGVGSVDVPLRIAAGSALRSVRDEGLPRAFPHDEEFAASATELETAYELSWLVTRMIAREYGEPQLVAFSRAVTEGADVDRAARDVLGVGEAALTREWQTYLSELASGG